MDTPAASPVTPRHARRLAALPGPRPWPLLGNLPQTDPLRLHARLEQWVGEYGPLYRFRMGRRDALVVAQPELVAAILRDRPDGWRRLQTMQSVIDEMGARGLFSAEGDDWRKQRNGDEGVRPGTPEALLPVAAARHRALPALPR